MNKKLVNLFFLLVLTGCASSGMMNETPYPESRETSSNVTIHRAVPKNLFFDNLVFTINDIDIYRYGKSDDFKFVLGEGNYMFGYKTGFWFFEKKCVADVEIYPGENYVFNLEPNCVIELL